MGKQKALVPVGPSILVIVHHVLKHTASDRELVGDDFARRHGERQRKRLMRQLEALGLKVTVEEAGEAA